MPLKTIVGNINSQQLNDNFSYLESNDTTIEQDLTSHKAENVTDVGGVHGFVVEAGIWTPTIMGTTVAGSNTYDTQNGVYYKKGNEVLIQCIVRMTSKDANMSGAIRVGGLPFSTANAYGTFAISRVHNVTDLTGGKNTIAYSGTTGNQISIAQNKSGSTSQVITDTNVAYNTLFEISGSYLI